jgi:peptidylprolyl isomerase
MILPGNRVAVHYTTRSLEGSVMESTRGREPIVFVAGGEEVIRGLSYGVVGLRAGDRRTLSIPPEQGFGNPNPELVQQLPLTALPAGLSNGDQLQLSLADADCDLWVQRVMAAEAQIDANHPLAGETLLVDLEIVRVDAA